LMPTVFSGGIIHYHAPLRLV
jgi:hypothetical protein